MAKAGRKKKRCSQANTILNHLMFNDSITSMEAFTKYGMTRLSAIIYSLRKEGYNIYSITEEHENRFGENCRFSRYFLSN